MAYCEECGKKLTDDVSFCEYCGTLVKQKNQNDMNEYDEIEEPQFELVTEVIPEEEQARKTQEKPPKRKWIVAAVLAILVIVVGGGGYWWFNHDNKKPAVQSSETNESTSSSMTKESTSISTEQSTQSAFNKQEVSNLADSTVGKLSNKTGVFVSMIDEKNIDYEKSGTTPIRAASIIKLFLLEAFYREVNEGTIRLDEPYVLKDTDKVSGTGVLQNYAEGTELTYEDLIRHMIVDSDNTAGNIIMNILGGPENTTKFIHNQGFNDTRIERKFVDSTALAAGKDNYTSAVDVGNLLKKIYQRKAVSPQYDQQMLEILKYNKNHSKLPKEIDSEVNVYNKTGEYTDYGVQNDACIFETNRNAYVVVVLSEDGDESQQVSAMNELGRQLCELLGKEKGE
ncbi:serine hydrolase [Enterococcus hulanensis]|uniref:Serine hydrolase n=1 Tax=Enterococcus hulanensis TaxID=2559929 RepID=A0ABU3F360_9ENTE|nr:serine hydrolase [Enterococcus hulanensis]MDT2600963.1 serine hydrolase [Enterococcus hulanensis]MDT2611552.1 serine hydrolase [Enterococcus hulanensis]MDT2617964.1 serine hydrolase [Enterococcus hulanensis]MDT2628967.1 serine hydrolase [Enterococcus hulanensis]MDT2656529.1 serine hydrolase [Enterococcus hulanensis]